MSVSIFDKQRIIQWILLAGLVEFFIFVFPNWQALVLLLAAAVFLIRFLSTALSFHNFGRETLNIDLLSFCLSLGLAAVATGLKPTNILILILIPLLVLPHIIYILIEK